MNRSIHLALLATAVLGLTLIFIQRQEPDHAGSHIAIGQDLRDALQQYGEIPIIIELHVPGHASRSAAELFFQLDAFQESVLVSNLYLYENMHLSLSYDPADVAGLDLEKLTLRYWANGRRQGGGASCSTHSAAQMVHCTPATRTPATPLLTPYALLENIPTPASKFGAGG